MTMMRQAAGALAAALVMAGAASAQDVASDKESVRRAIHVCAACHGEEGRSTLRDVPSLAGQMAQYTQAQLIDFRSQTRVENGSKAYMWGVSALLDDATIAGLANYYAAQKPAAGKPGNPALVKAGRRLFVDGAPSRGIRACASCHGEGAEGQAGFPRLAGQRADYIVGQLKVFGGKLRPHGVLMSAEVKQMTAAEMRAVAAYLQSL
jgi:cytochrome c553